MGKQAKKGTLRQIIILLLFAGLFVGLLASEASAMDYGHVFIRVKDGNRNPSSAYVSLDGRSCSGYGGGLYYIVTSPGWHKVCINGISYSIYVYANNYSCMTAYVK